MSSLRKCFILSTMASIAALICCAACGDGNRVELKEGNWVHLEDRGVWVRFAGESGEEFLTQCSHSKSKPGESARPALARTPLGGTAILAIRTTKFDAFERPSSTSLRVCAGLDLLEYDAALGVLTVRILPPEDEDE